MERKYYEAYDDRYRQVHARGLQWFDDAPSVIVSETICKYRITPKHSILELGCGEGRDAIPLLKAGYQLTATDISGEAIRFCREKMPDFAGKFHVLDCVADKLEAQFDFIYAIAVIHMLVEDNDRNAFYQFIRKHLKPRGIALICAMGDGVLERCTDPRAAFDIHDRIHEQTGTPVQIASTSCRIVSCATFKSELIGNGLSIKTLGFTAVEPDFSQMMCAVVGCANRSLATDR